MTTTMNKTNAINWFELPVLDLDRARRFYEQVLGTSLRTSTFGGTPMAMFPSSDDAVGGALIATDKRKPAGDGALLFLNANGALDECQRRIEAAGGKVVVPKTDIGEHGHFLVLLDTEGNQVGLHAERAG